MRTLTVVVTAFLLCGCAATKPAGAYIDQKRGDWFFSITLPIED